MKWVYHSPHFRDEETEAKRDQEVTGPVYQRKVQLRCCGHSEEGEHTSGVGLSEHLNVGLEEQVESVREKLVGRGL